MDSERNVDIIESEFFKVQEKDTTKIQKTDTYNIKNDSTRPEVVVVGGFKKDTSVEITEKCIMSGYEPLIKKSTTVFSYYILSNDFDSTIIGKEKIELSKMRKNNKNPLLRICDDSTFTIDYNQVLDTIVVLNPNNNEMISQVIKKADTFRGTGWVLPNKQYVNFIV